MLTTRTHLIERLAYEVMIKMDKEILQGYVYSRLVDEYSEMDTRFLLKDAIRYDIIKENEDVTICEND